MPRKKADKIEVYLTDGYRERLERLIKKLKADGVDLKDDNRPGSISRSKLIRYLIDKELAQDDTEESDTAPTPTRAPLKAAG